MYRIRMIKMNREKKYNKNLRRVQFWLTTLHYSKIGIFFPAIYDVITISLI